MSKDAGCRYSELNNNSSIALSLLVDAHLGIKVIEYLDEV